MKRCLIALLLACPLAAHATDHFARSDGANRDDPTNGVWAGCDGTVDQSYVAAGAAHPWVAWQPSQTVGSGYTIAIAGYSGATGYYWSVTTPGTTQSGAGPTFTGTTVVDGTATWTRGSSVPRLHCAFSSPIFFWSNGNYNVGSGPNWSWVGAGGDRYISSGSIADGVSYRIGWSNPSSYCDANGCWGITGDAADSGPPPPPSGSSGAHTQILGGNYASCSAQSSRTQWHGGWGVFDVLNLKGASYVDVSCIDMTDFSQCSAGASPYVSCSGQDMASNGILIDNSSAHITLSHSRLHGLASAGILGAPGGDFTATDIQILGNGFSGWNSDDGSSTTGHGTTLFQNYVISWNGCPEEYPIVDPLPYIGCRDQSTGGYGDGFGSTTLDSTPQWNITFDTGSSEFNTQDGLDALHIAGTGSTITVLRTQADSNEGQQIKAGGATATIQNSVITTNCDALLQVIPGRPSPTHDDLGAVCRAGNTGVLMHVAPGTTSAFQDNTIFTGGKIALEIEYESADHGSTNLMLYNNNIFNGFFNTEVGQNPTPIFSNSDLNMLTNPGSSWTHNDYFGYRSNWTCPNASESQGHCVDPQLAGSSYPAYGTVTPSVIPNMGSPMIGAGVNPPNLSLDFYGTMRPNPPSIGQEPSGTPSNIGISGGATVSGGVIVSISIP